MNTKLLKDKVFKSGRWTATSAAFGLVLQLVNLIFLSRLLTPQDFGLYAMMLVVVGFISNLADLGMGNYLVQLDTINKTTLSKIIFGIIILTFVLAILLVLSSDSVADYYRQQEIAVLLPAMAVYFFFLVLSQFFISLLQRMFEFKRLAIGEIISGFISTISTIGLAILGYGIWSIIIGQIVVASSKFLLFVFPVIKFWNNLPDKDDKSISHAKSFAFFQTGERILNYLGANLDKMFIGRGLGDSSLGNYSLPFQLIMKPISIINPIFTRVAFPAFVNIRGDNLKLIKGYLELLRVNAFIIFPIFLFTAFSSNLMVEFIFGAKWSEAGPILYILSFLGMFFVLGNPLGILVLSKGKPNWSFYWNLLATSLNLVVFWYGSYFSSLAVAKLYLLISAFILYPFEFYFRYRLVGMTVSQYFGYMGHLLIATLIPILFHQILIYFHFIESGFIFQLGLSLILTSMFFGYLFIANRSLFITVIKLLKNRSH